MSKERIEISTKEDDNNQSNRYPDSAGSYYYGQTPEIIETFDYTRATASAFIDSASGEVNLLVITDSGFGYSSVPNVVITGGRSASLDSQYAIGDDGFRAKEVISILRCLAEEQSA